MNGKAYEDCMNGTNYLDGLDFAKKMDSLDELRPFRKEFAYPSMKDIKKELGVAYDDSDSKSDSVYLCGQSLGLMPRKAVTYITRELDKWARIGVLGHTHGELPWERCEDFCIETVAKLFGCEQDEVIVMNNLTSNIHLLLSSFYRPTQSRFKIAIEGDAFPSDHYALESHASMHGFDEKEALVVFKPREGEMLISDDDIVARIEAEGDKLATIFMSAVHFKTGQLFDIPRIVEAGHKVGALVGIDLAHAIGNVPLYLDKWGLDFACCCSYKYLNSGAGGIGLCYINRAHFNRQPRLIGWWAHKLKTRFVMNNKLDLDSGAAGFKTGNQSPLLCAPLLASLELYRDAGIERLRAKSKVLSGYLEWLLTKSELYADLIGKKAAPAIVTPSDPHRRGAQISIRIANPPGVDTIAKELEKQGVVGDIRRPDIIRVAPVPMYNSFEDVYRFAVILKQVLLENV